jgi:hypothetical protein
MEEKHAYEELTSVRSNAYTDTHIGEATDILPIATLL